MRLAIIGLGRMGGNIARRLLSGGHEVVAYDRDPEARSNLAAAGAEVAGSLEETAIMLAPPRVFWVMLPAGAATENTISGLLELASPGDAIIDGGNTFFKDDIRRARVCGLKDVNYLDVGTSGGVWGLQRGYCLMIGGETPAVAALKPIWETLAPGLGTVPRTPDRGEADEDPRAELGYIHAGPAGAGHFVKMVHNGIEYGLMQAYAEGFDILKGRASERLPEDERFSLNLTDIAEVWRRGSVISSWLLDLSAAALAKDNMLEPFTGRVSDSGEGRWTVEAALEEAVPAHVLSAAVLARYRSRVDTTFADKLLSAMRYGFGGHVEIPQ
ncbi:decarboxylating 6-phosphogluconate dehydrogenase [Altererythrobacter aerius]|uniref:Decarboxylating 6-phosphogluconate dehydrogenase n=1 Tax=Tsuneonella aeria TaxID=1837929 RepID=A0A6I4TJC9_9SPHN|nr:decarboxylating 6-phosphogluconate dehydrogenase [Tsuneonella aeria]MXO76155.1 decarboxylating 6-phosphogluconate dehydrogenase [Tsuneonella aeria]